MIVEINALYAGFFFNDTATTEIYTLSLHDALPISADTTTAEGTATADTTAAEDTTTADAAPADAIAKSSGRCQRAVTMNSGTLDLPIIAHVVVIRPNLNILL